MGKLFSGSTKQKQTNSAYGQINTALTPVLNATGAGVGGMQALLGGDSTGFDAYKKATGFDATAEMGSRGITGNAAAKGLLRSGSTGMALQNYGQTLQNQYAGDYMDGLGGVSDLGLKAGALIGDTATKKTTSRKKPGLASIAGKIASAYAGGV